MYDRQTCADVPSADWAKKTGASVFESMLMVVFFCYKYINFLLQIFPIQGQQFKEDGFTLQSLIDFLYT